LARLQRRRRIRCTLPCEIVEQGRGRSEGTVRSLSEGGLSVEAALDAEQGDPIRLRIVPHRRARAVDVDGIVWNESPGRRGRNGARLRLLGCVVSQPPAGFLELLAELEERDAAPPGFPARRPASVRPRRAAVEVELQTDLPRSRAPLPPPKPEPEESLPRFRVRLKQLGGPRTRILVVRARSMADAQERAGAELGRDAEAGCAWEVLDVLPGGGGSSRVGG